MDVIELQELIRTLRLSGEHEGLEVKSAAGGLPASLNATLSAFGNQPGGGLILLGIDEGQNFRAVELSDPGELARGLASKARTAVVPPVQIVIDLLELEGQTIVVGRVDELPAAHKPCRVGGPTGLAYLRVHDGDYELSALEVQALTAARSQPLFDREPVLNATVEDLDRTLVRVYLDTARSVDRRLAAMSTDEEILKRTGVVVDHQPTLAGLLALGVFPQQFFPSLAIQAVVPPQPGDSPALRYRASQRFTGPIPYMLEESVRWVLLNSSNAAAVGTDGHLRDLPAWPPEALREAIGNALVHRDLGPWALSEAITIRVEPATVTITSPGGLYGLRVERLQPDNVDSFARNAALQQICQYTRLPDGRRVVEGLATGIPKVFQTLQEGGFPPPRFYDKGVRFTCKFHTAQRSLAARSHTNAQPAVTVKERVLQHLQQAPTTSANLATLTDTPIQTIRNTLRVLVTEGLVQRHGGQGTRLTMYALTKPA